MIKKIIIYGGGLVILLWLSGLCRFAWQINHFGTASAKKTDAIIALTGGRNRIAEAVKLLEKGMADRLFISGVDKSISLENIQNPQHLDLTRKMKIDVGHNASNTIENAKETAQWIKQNNIKSIRLVTSNYHVSRSLIEFREHNPDLEIILHPVYSEQIKKNWWTSWRTFSLIFKEYNKFLYVIIRNKLR